jgi:hypothetical protein|tara:strand:+ start:1004 stop:1780 length:777 start_codon:yes stop_codon:yes gene_type:complete
MTSLLQMDIKDLFKGKKDSVKKDSSSDSNVQKILLKRLLAIILLIFLIFISYWFFLKPRSEVQRERIEKLKQWEEQIVSCNKEIELLTIKQSELNQLNEDKGKLFVSNEEFENFYAKLYEATGSLGLTIVDVTRMEEIPVYVSKTNIRSSENSYDTSTTTKDETPCDKDFDYATYQSQPETDLKNCDQNNPESCKEIAYFKMLVDFEIRGTFPDYIEFRNIIASEKKIVNIEKEEIIKDEADRTQIIAKATVSLVKAP